MSNPIPMVEIWRGDLIESLHTGHAVVCDERGQIVQAWGDPDAIIYPRSSCKMIQALPLLESGAAKAAGLQTQHLAIACASHQGAKIHTDLVTGWLSNLGLSEDDLRCGPNEPGDKETHYGLIRAFEEPCQIHNVCSGKHCGFLTYTKHVKAGPEYVEPDHPLQMAIREVIEDLTGVQSPGYGIDGCSTPNFATSVHGLARAMAFFASASEGRSVREDAAFQLSAAMRAFPEFVAGEGRACTELMRAMDGRVAVKTGADGMFVAIIPELKLGVALKIRDGATRASECAMAAILVKLGVLDANHPATLKRMNAVQRNCRGLETGIVRPTAALT